MAKSRRESRRKSRPASRRSRRRHRSRSRRRSRSRSRRDDPCYRVYQVRVPVIGDLGRQAWRVGYYRVFKDRTMVPMLGFNRFGKERIPYPEGAQKSKLSEYARSQFCREARPKPKFKEPVLEVEEWIKKTKPKHLRIKDVIKMKPGQRVKMLMMDRNMYDVLNSKVKGNQAYTTKFFFNKNTVIYVHKKDLEGYLIWNWDQKKEKVPFVFDIEYAPNSWYPLYDGKLPAKDPQGFAKFSHTKPKSWKSFPKNTRIGYRGPMMPWNLVVQSPKIYQYER